MSERSFEMVEAGSAPGEDGTPRFAAAQRAADMLRSAQAVQDWRSGQTQLQGSVDQPPMAPSPVPSSVGGASTDAILAELFATTPIAAAPVEPLLPLPQLPPIHTGQRSSYAGGSHTGPHEHSPSSGRPSSAPTARRSFLNDDSRATAHARVRQLAEAVGFDLPSLDIQTLPPRSPLGAPASRSHPATPRPNQGHATGSPPTAAAGVAGTGEVEAPSDELGVMGDADEDATSPEERVAQLEEERDVLVDKLLDTTEALHDSETRFLAKSAAAEQVHALLVQLQDLLRRAEGERDRAQRQLQAAAASATIQGSVSHNSGGSSSSMAKEAVAVQTEAVVMPPADAEGPVHAAGSGSSRDGDSISGTAAAPVPSKQQSSGPSAKTSAGTKAAAAQAQRQSPQPPPQQQQQHEEGWPVLAAVRSQLCGMASRLRWRDAAVLLSCGALLALLLLTHSATWRAGLQAGAREQRIAELQEQVAALQAQVEAGEGAGVAQPQQCAEAAKWHMHRGRVKQHERHKGHQDSSASRSWDGARHAHNTQNYNSGHSRQALGGMGSTTSSASSKVRGWQSSNTNGGVNSTSSRPEPTVQVAAAMEAAQKRLEQLMLNMQEQLQAWARAHQQRSSGPTAGASASDAAATAQPKEQHTHHHTHHHVHNHACDHTQDANAGQAPQQQGQMSCGQPESALHLVNVTAEQDSAQDDAQRAGKQPQQLQEQQQCVPVQQQQEGSSKQQASTQTDPPVAAQLDAAAMHSKAALDAVWARMKQHSAALHQPDAVHMRVVKALRDDWLVTAKRGVAAAPHAAHQVENEAAAATAAKAAATSDATAAAKAAADAAAADTAAAREAAAWPDSHAQVSHEQQASASHQEAEETDHQTRPKVYEHQHQHQHQYSQAQPAPTPLPPSQPANSPVDHTSSSSSSPSWPSSPALMSAHQTLLSELSRLATAASMHKRLSAASPITKACSLLSPDQQPKLPWLSARRLRRVEGLLSNVCQGAASHDRAALPAALSALQAPLGELHAAVTDKGNVAAWRRALADLHREMTSSESQLAKALPRLTPGPDVTWRSMRRVLKKAAKSLDLALAHALQHASRQVWQGMQTDGEDARKLVLRMWDARHKAGLALEQMASALDDVLQAEAAAEVLTAARAKGAGADGDGGNAGGGGGGGSGGAVYNVDRRVVEELGRSYKEVVWKLGRMG